MHDWEMCLVIAIRKLLRLNIYLHSWVLRDPKSVLNNGAFAFGSYHIA